MSDRNTKGRRPGPVWTGGDKYDAEVAARIADRTRFGGEWRRCPKCGTIDTVARRTIGTTVNSTYVMQWRKCRNTACQHPFKAAKPN